MYLAELHTIHPYMTTTVRKWNKKDDRITIITMDVLTSYIGRCISSPDTGVAVAMFDAIPFGKILGMSWTLFREGMICADMEWRSATIIDRSIRGRGFGQNLFNFKVALFKHRTGSMFPEVTLDPNNIPSYRMVRNAGIAIRENPDRKEI